MTINNAIEILENELRAANDYGYYETAEALELAIECMKGGIKNNEY